MSDPNAIYENEDENFEVCEGCIYGCTSHCDNCEDGDNKATEEE